MLIFQDGFEQYGGDASVLDWAYESHDDVTLDGTPRDDHGSALKIAAGGQITRNFGQHDAIYFGFAAMLEAPGEGFNLRFQDFNGADQVTFTMNADGFFEMRLGGPADTVVATSKRKMFASQYYFLEMRVEIAQQLGAVHFRLQEEIGMALLNTATDTTHFGITKLKIENGTSAALHIDDLYNIDQTEEEYWDKWLGDIKVNTYRVLGDGPTQQWTPLDNDSIVTGQHHLQINETIPDGDATVIDAGDGVKVDEFTMTQDQIKEPWDGAVMAISLLPLINNTGTKVNPNHTGSDWRLGVQLIRGSDGLISSISGLDKKIPFGYSFQCYNLVRWRPEGAHFPPNIMDTTRVRLTGQATFPQ